MKNWMPFQAVRAFLRSFPSKAQHLDGRTGKIFVLSTGVGREFTVRLGFNPNVGNDWREDYDPSMLRLEGVTFQPTSATHRGAEELGTLTLKFEALKAGETVMTLLHRCGWEETPPDRKVFAVSID